MWLGVRLIARYDDIHNIPGVTHHPLVLAVYSPSPSFPIGTCAPAPPVDDEHDLVASAVATAMLFVEDMADRMSTAEKNFMIIGWLPFVW